MAKRNAIAGQFAARPIAMLESAAYRTLSRAAHQVLSRIEIEHAHHGGVENGELPVTYDHFVEYGLHRHAIAPAIRELAALGFIEVTRRGCALNGDLQQVSLYRLTFRHAKRAAGDGTYEWRRITTIGQAEALAKAARHEVDPRVRDLAIARVQKQNASDGFRQLPVTETITESEDYQCRKPSLQRVSETVTTSISRRDAPQHRGTLRPPDDGEPGRVDARRRGDQTPGLPPSQSHGEPKRPADEGEAAVSAPKVPPFDLIEDAFRIGDRRLELRKPVAAVSLTAGQLAQQLAALAPLERRQAGSAATSRHRRRPNPRNSCRIRTPE
jgi:hypothetical protein